MTATETDADVPDDGRDYFDDGTPHPGTRREWAALLARAAAELAVRSALAVALVRLVYWCQGWPWGRP